MDKSIADLSGCEVKVVGLRASRLLTLWVRIPPGVGGGVRVSVSCGYCVLLCVGFCVRLIIRLEESYRVCRYLEASVMRRSWRSRACCATLTHTHTHTHTHIITYLTINFLRPCRRVSALLCTAFCVCGSAFYRYKFYRCHESLY